MGFLDFLKGSSDSEELQKTHTLIALDWDRMKRNVSDLSFLGELTNPVIWVFTQRKVDQKVLGDLLNNRPFEVQTQPDYEKKLSVYLINAVLFEFFNNPRYKKIVFLSGNDFLSGTVAFLKAQGIAADLRIFDAPGKRSKRRSDDRDSRTSSRDTRSDKRKGGKKDNKPTQKGKPERNKELLNDPKKLAGIIEGSLQRNLKTDEKYTLSRVAQIIKDATTLSVSDIFGYRGNRTLINHLKELNNVETIDNRNFKLLKFPKAEDLVPLIENRSSKSQQRSSHPKSKKGDQNDAQQNQEAENEKTPEKMDA